MKPEVIKISKEEGGRISAPFTPMNEAKSVAEYVAIYVPITGLYRCIFPYPYFRFKDGEEVAESDVLILEQQYIYTMFASVGDRVYPFALWDSKLNIISNGEYAPEWIKFPTQEEIKAVLHSLINQQK